VAKKKQHSSWKNVEKYNKGKDQLRHSVLQHPEEDPKTSAFDFVKSRVTRNLWVIPYEKFKKGDK